MTVDEILELVEELKIEEEKTIKVPHYYKRNGQMLRRSYDDEIYTERYDEIFEIISEAKVFKCCECGEMVTYFDLETWCCDFEGKEYICSCCYENAMGDDL